MVLKNVARRFKKLWAMKKIFMGNVFDFYEQCFLRLWAIFFAAMSHGNKDYWPANFG